MIKSARAGFRLGMKAPIRRGLPTLVRRARFASFRWNVAAARDHRPVARARGVRVIAGEAGGRRLVVPRGDRVRPTTDRVKESLFSALGESRLIGARVLDLYAGTGALGIEALSRGAALAVFVERDPLALRAIAQNVEATSVSSRTRVVKGDVAAFLGGPPATEAPFDLVLLDPPYDLPDPALAPVLEALARRPWTVPSAVVVIERAADAGPPPWPPGWQSTWNRCYGDTLLWFATSSEESG
jgi:16S rRNA (guanine966-N2)-methyltransferase